MIKLTSVMTEFQTRWRPIRRTFEPFDVRSDGLLNHLTSDLADFETIWRPIWRTFKLYDVRHAVVCVFVGMTLGNGSSEGCRFTFRFFHQVTCWVTWHNHVVCTKSDEYYYYYYYYYYFCYFTFSFPCYRHSFSFIKTILLEQRVKFNEKFLNSFLNFEGLNQAL